MTAPTGEHVWINTNDCSRVRVAVAAHEHAHTIIDGNFGSQAVTESVEMVMKVLSKC